MKVQEVSHPALSALREFALAYPEAKEEFPWGHRAIKVKGKIFATLVSSKDGVSISVKLPHSGRMALLQPYASPTEYGLGKSGWVTARFEPGAEIPVDLLEQWIDESYRAIALKKLVARLDEGADSGGNVGEQPVAKAARKRRRGHGRR